MDSECNFCRWLPRSAFWGSENGAEMAVVLSCSDTIQNCNRLTDKNVLDYWRNGEKRKRSWNSTLQCLYGLCFLVSSLMSVVVDGRWGAGTLPKITCPGEVALELECTALAFQTLDPNYYSALLQGKSTSSRGKKPGHHSFIESQICMDCPVCSR